MKKTVEDFQQMIQERLTKVEEIKSCLKLSAVSPDGNVYPCTGICLSSVLLEFREDIPCKGGRDMLFFLIIFFVFPMTAASEEQNALKELVLKLPTQPWLPLFPAQTAARCAQTDLINV